MKYKKAAVKYLRKMPSLRVNQFFQAFSRIAESDTEGLDISSFSGVASGYRLRIGNYRAIYTIVENELIIEVVKIGARGDIYK